MKHIPWCAASLAVLAMLALAITPAPAAWNPGDPYKMHYPQLPDLDGWDVRFTFNRLADDWRCTSTGPVSDIHFWFSSHYDYPIGYMGSIYAAIHSNDTSDPSFAKPGDVLWERTFDLWTLPYDGFDYEASLYGVGSPPGFYQYWPPNNYVFPADHKDCYQANITDIEDLFIQQAGTVYWLELSVGTVSGLMGWKTSASDPFGSRALFGGAAYEPAVWAELPDPSVGPPLSGDFAFVITTDTGGVIPEPCALVVWSVLGTIGLVVGWRRCRVA